MDILHEIIKQDCNMSSLSEPKLSIKTSFVVLSINTVPSLDRRLLRPSVYIAIRPTGIVSDARALLALHPLGIVRAGGRAVREGAPFCLRGSQVLAGGTPQQDLCSRVGQEEEAAGDCG